jgi:hypothetical protein
MSSVVTVEQFVSVFISIGEVRVDVDSNSIYKQAVELEHVAEAFLRYDTVRSVAAVSSYA